MKTTAALLLAALAGTAARQACASSSFPGMGVSLGRGRATARVTFDRKKAAGGGFIFAVERADASDLAAIRLSEAVITGSRSLTSRAAVACRAHGVAAIVPAQARWEAAALALESPVFGRPEAAGGALVWEPLERVSRRRLSEGEVATVDPAAGTITVYDDSAAGERELELSQALRAYEGLSDSSALIHWLEGRGDGQTSARLIEELSDAVLRGSARAADLADAARAAERLVPAAGLKALRAEELAAFERRKAAFLSRLAELRGGALEAGTARAVERLEADAASRWEGLKSIADALGAKGSLGPAARAEAEFSRLAGKRLSTLAKRPAQDWREAAAAAGASAPETVRLPPDLYGRFLSEFGLDPLISEIASDASLDLRRKSERIGKLFGAAKLAADSPVGAAVLELLPRGEFYAVSLGGGSAGARESVLASPADVLDAVKAAWASIWEPDALGRRKRQGEAPPRPEVFVAALSAVAVSGALWTRDPGSGSAARWTAEAVYGEGGPSEGAADQYVFDPRSGEEVLPALVADKRERLVWDPARKALVKAAIPPGLSLTRTLSPERLKKLARAGRALDAHFGDGLEVSFAFQGERLLVAGVRVLEPPKGIKAAAEPFALPAADSSVPAVRSLPSKAP